MLNNPISYSLQQCRYKIPREILEKIFISLATMRGGQILNRYASISLDARIREEVIEPRVLQDCNLYGGREMMIPLQGMPCEILDNNTAIYRIPKSATAGATIVCATSVQANTSPLYGLGNSSLAAYGASQVLDSAANVLASHGNIPAIATAYVQVIAENTIQVMDGMGLTPNITLRCWVSNDEQLSHLMPTSYPIFSDLVVWAVKAFIYVNAQIVMDKGFVSSGSELGRFRETIDEYRDANENYDTILRKVWPKVVVLNDANAKARHIKLLVGGKR